MIFWEKFTGNFSIRSSSIMSENIDVPATQSLQLLNKDGFSLFFGLIFKPFFLSSC